MSTLTYATTASAQGIPVDALFGFSKLAFDAFEKLVALNLQTTKASMFKNDAIGTEPLGLLAKDPQSFLLAQSQHSQAYSKKAQAYWHQVADIATETRTQFLASSELLVADYVRGSQVIIGSLDKNPLAANGAIAAFWSKGLGAFWDAGNTVHERTTAAAKEAIDVINKSSKSVMKA